MLSQLWVLQQHGWERREGSCRWLLGVVMKEPCYVPPVLELMKG